MGQAKKTRRLSIGKRPSTEDSIFHGAVVEMLRQQRTYFKRLLGYLESKEKYDRVK